MDIAFIPVALEALALERPTPVVGPLSKFEQLPWTDGKKDHNADRPWLGQSVQRTVFERANHVLAPGVHLHWTLPDGLTRGSPGMKFPTLPDRWFIRRTGATSTTDGWIVESDYLNTDPNNQSGVAWPLDVRDGAPPFGRLGRQFTLQDWLNRKVGGDRQLVTAMGYGEAAFAAFYPACQSVFGFHDPDGPAGKAGGYEIIGWHSRPGEDPLGQFLRASSSDEPAWDVLQRFHWRFSDQDDQTYRQEAPSPPVRMICYGRLSLVHNDPVQPLPTPSVILANSGMEALPVAASLDEQLPLGDMSALSIIENTLAALHLLPDMTEKKVDRGPAFEELRHEKTFLAEPGGDLWTLRAVREPDAPTEAGTSRDLDDATLPPTLSQHLQDLNAHQALHDAASIELNSLRQRLYADWSKYMMTAYPDLDDRREKPGLDAIRAFIQAGDLIEIGARQAKLGSTGLTFGADGALTEANVDRNAGDLSRAITINARRSLNKLRVFNATGLSGQRGGRPDLTTDDGGQGFLEFNGRTTALALDWVQGWGDWPRLGGSDRLHALTVHLRFRPDAIKTADVLSFDGEENFAIQVVRRKGALHVAFKTMDWASRADLLVSDSPLRIGEWIDLVATFDGEDGTKRLWINGNPAGERSNPGLISIGSPVRRLGVLGAASQSAERDTAAGARRFKGAIARLSMFPERAIAASEVLALATRPRPPALALKREGAPRFWRPRDPVVMLQGPAAIPSRRHRRGDLRCHTIHVERFEGLYDESRRGKQRAIDNLLDGVRSIAGSHPDGAGFQVGNGRPWHPLMLEWETALHPFTENGPHGDGRDSYAKNFITEAFEVDPDGPEIAARAGVMPIPDRVSINSGRVILTPFAAELHQRRHKQAQRTLSDGSKDKAPPAISFEDTLSQALGGFHAALLQQHEGLGLPPDDPLAFPGRRAFSRTQVRNATGPQSMAATSPNQPFLPIRAGSLEIRRLRLIDAFGQVMDVPINQIHSSTRLQNDAHSSMVTMPPRLSQPARLNFRWLSADRNVEMMNDHPTTSPVCGWIVPNYLDNGLQVHAADGDILGEIAPGLNPVWRPVPGSNRAPEPESFENPALGRVIRALISAEPDRRLALLDTIRMSLDAIHPANDAMAGAQALIMGRPLAIVRASLDLQLRGLPAVNHDWGVFARDVDRRTRDHAGFTHVHFPVRLGEHHRLDDGLVGFWREDADSLPTGAFHAPVLDRGKPEQGMIGRLNAEFPLTLSVAGGPEIVTMLVDPMGCVHATSGILPVKSIRIPPDQYGPAMDNIGGAFLTAPVLAPGGRIALSLPQLTGQTWSWTEPGETPGDWNRVGAEAIRPPRHDGAFEGTTEIREGWLVLSRNKTGSGRK